MTYYTPHIDELFIGMECESKIDGEWVQTTITSLNVDEPIQYRLHYLNADDIINEEFLLRYETREYKAFNKVLYSNETPFEIDVHVLKGHLEPIIRILKGNEIILDTIVVKNRYEFKWLIERLL